VPLYPSELQGRIFLQNIISAKRFYVNQEVQRT